MFMAKIIIDNSKLSADSVIKNGVNKAMLSAPRLAKEMIITVPSKLLFFLFVAIHLILHHHPQRINILFLLLKESVPASPKFTLLEQALG